MKTKSVPALVKSSHNDDSLEEGQFTAVVSVFNTVDSVGDVVLPGAFKDSLSQWATKGSPLPVVWSHDWSDPFSHIGYVTEAKETDTGLQVKGQLDLENPKAKQVYNLLKGGRVRNWSFAYDIDQARPGERNGKSVQELHQLSVHEIGPTLVGAHKDTDTVDVKAAPSFTVNVNPPAAVAEQTDDRIEAAVDAVETAIKDTEVEVKAFPPAGTPKPIVARIRKLATAINDLLAAVDPPASQTDDSKAMPAQPSQPEPPAVVAPGPDPVRHGAASSRLRTDLELLELEAATYTI